MPVARLDLDSDSTYSINMKAVQVMLDERLLTELDATKEVREEGRSAVLRRALAAYLRRRRRESIADGYERAYLDEDGLGTKWDSWEEQGVWPAE